MGRERKLSVQSWEMEAHTKTHTGTGVGNAVRKAEEKTPWRSWPGGSQAFVKAYPSSVGFENTASGLRRYSHLWHSQEPKK